MQKLKSRSKIDRDQSQFTADRSEYACMYEDEEAGSGRNKDEDDRRKQECGFHSNE